MLTGAFLRTGAMCSQLGDCEMKSNPMDSESRGSAVVVSASLSTHVNIQANKKHHVISAAVLFSGCAKSSRLDPHPASSCEFTRSRGDRLDILSYRPSADLCLHFLLFCFPVTEMNTNPVHPSAHRGNKTGGSINKTGHSGVIWRFFVSGFPIISIKPVRLSFFFFALQMCGSF